jgi:hypothetical protein
MEDTMKRHNVIWIILLSALLAMTLALTLPGCRKAREEAKEQPNKTDVIVPTAPAEVCAPFAGTWDTNHGELTVVQEGCEADGTLKGIGGGYYKLEGHVTNETWDFKWKGPEGRGRGYFTMDPVGGRFIGENGEGENNTGKGKWDGTIIK